ncbi:MAG: AraD1 family protein, partial [Pseudomonadota bacterium]
AHCLITGTGLTHLGSAQARDSMHEVTKQDMSELSDSMRMFRLGLEGGQIRGDQPGVAPEWFYKGDGSVAVAPGQPLTSPGFALDGGEEAEVAALYLIDDSGCPCRLGYALGNEFSDHVLERQNYLYLAHSKLRPCSFGPELLLGDLPGQVQGTVSVLRGEDRIWQAEWLSGEGNMSHALANLEHHHFKYSLFRKPGDVHVHFLGAAVLSYTAGIKPLADDVFEIHSPTFGAPLRNPVAIAEDEGMVRVKAL